MPRGIDAERIEFVQRQVVQDVPPFRIVEAVVAQFQVSDRQAWRYVERVQKDIDARGPLGKLELMQRLVYRRAMAEGKLPTASAAAARCKNLVADPASTKRYEAIGPPPGKEASSLERVAWTQRIVLETVAEAATDPALSPRERRREVREGGRVVAALTDKDQIADVDKRLRDESERMGDTSEAELEDAPEPSATDSGEALRAQ